MFTTLFTHAACLDHDTGLGHPECSDRLRAVLAALETEEFHMLERQEAPRATVEQLLRAHPQSHIDRVMSAIPATEHVGIDGDTVVSPGSGEAALRAAGAVVAAVDSVATGQSRNAFCAVRPPGHHAEREKPMGFCLFNNAAVGAFHARAAHGLQRVAVMDFDVHHGNGTQDIFQHDPDMLYCSTHQSPLYPGTGDAGEKGEYGNCVNAPLPAMAGSPEFRHAMTHIVLPAIDHFKPDLLIISAGFDAHSRDPMAGLHFIDDDFVWATRKLGELARTHCGARIVSVLEGGYNLRALASASAAHVRELMYC
ncbi:histone deacetylase family protein [Azospirillum cavernae]|uniref:Histone deacetylase family protein n=1 Tax=Azospirillum cavernae TaxID=2320860 RepID=A0A418VV33_9PROT|nr:histone deacetylase family protein [Azospirillum cavernae]RJF80984.1 histone deacetylase family protein [Azospirillum cavernae]